MELNERLMADAACLDPVYVDGIAGVLNLGDNFGMLFYRWMPRCASNGGAIIYEKNPVLYLVRPRASLLLPGTLGALVRCQPQPRGSVAAVH